MSYTVNLTTRNGIVLVLSNLTKEKVGKLVREHELVGFEPTRNEVKWYLKESTTK